MRHGGSQLIEILEKEFQYEELLLSGERLGISPSQLQRLQIWIESNCDIEIAAERNELHDKNFSKSFFYRGAGMLAILYRSLDLSPVIQNDQFLSRFSFIWYNVIKTELGSLVISEIVKRRWSNFDVSSYEKSSMTQYFFYDSKFNRIEHNNSLSRELLDMYKVTQIMTEDE
jgi:hypothetical protein